MFLEKIWEKKIESHYLPLLLTLQIRQPNKRNSSSWWNTNSIRNWNPNDKIRTKKKKRSKTIRIEPAKNSKQNQNPHPIWERESEWEKERIGMRERERIHHCCRSKLPCHCRRSPNHHAIAADLQSMLPILISNPRWFERPTTKIQSKPKPTSNLRERIRVREREDRNEITLFRSKIDFILETEQKRLNLARTVLDDDVAILANSTSLMRVSLGVSGIGLGLVVVLLSLIIFNWIFTLFFSF